MAWYPCPTARGRPNNLLVNANSTKSWDSILGKVDHRFRDADMLSVRFTKRYFNSLNPYDGGDTGAFGDYINSHDSLGGLNYTHMFTPTLINEARFGVSRTARHETGPTIGTDISGEARDCGRHYRPKNQGFPIVSVSGLAGLGESHLQPRDWTLTNYQAGDTLTWVKFRHMLKSGFDALHTLYFEPYNNNQRGTFNFLGRWTNHPTADFLLGLPNSTTRAGGVPLSYLFSTNYGFFAQDDFKINSRLTLNLGLRYELPKPIIDKYDRWSNFVPDYGKIVLAGTEGLPNLDQVVKQAGLTGRIATAADYGMPRSLIYANQKDFAPRIGLAWRPFGGTRTVVRGGYGIFYSQSLTKDVRQDLGAGFPFSSRRRSTASPAIRRR